MKNKRFLSLLITFGLAIGLICVMTASVSALPPSTTRTMSINWTLASGGTSTGVTAVHLNAGDYLGVNITFTPQGTLSAMPMHIDFGIVDEAGVFTSFDYSLGGTSIMNSTKILIVPKNGVYKFRIRNRLNVSVNAKGTFVYNKPNNTFTKFCFNSNTATIMLEGAISKSSSWRPIISDACSFWNNSKAGVNIEIVTIMSGPPKHTLEVNSYNWDDFGRCMRLYAPDSDFAYKSSIEINSRTIGASTNSKRSTLTHEMGHLFWLGDNPYRTNANISLMNHTRDRNIVYKPQIYDVNNIKWAYG